MSTFGSTHIERRISCSSNKVSFNTAVPGPTVSPSPQMLVQVKFAFNPAALQVHPFSNLHVELHASPFLLLPSSHSSVIDKIPSPQSAVQVEGTPIQLQPLSTEQVLLQPSKSFKLPSSLFCQSIQPYKHTKFHLL
jgi:hypothetical protein